MSESLAQSAGGTGGTATTTGTDTREARLTVAAADLADIGTLVSLWRDAGLRNFDVLACEERGAVVQVHVRRALNRADLASVDCVDRWAHVSETPDAHQYVVAFTAPTFPPSIAARRADLLDSCDPDIDDDGLVFSLVGPLDAVADVIDDLRHEGLAPDLLRVGPYTGRDGPLDGLTKRQREVVTTAYELGYYEVPRTVSSEEVAAELNLDPSTVSEHLQRAERNFLTRQLSVRR